MLCEHDYGYVLLMEVISTRGGKRLRRVVVSGSRNLRPLASVVRGVMVSVAGHETSDHWLVWFVV